MLAYPYAEAAAAILPSDTMVITAGAGMGVDFGLPYLRGNKGFWNAYPMYEQLGLSFDQAPILIISNVIHCSGRAFTVIAPTSIGAPFPTAASFCCLTGSNAKTSIILL